MATISIASLAVPNWQGCASGVALYIYVNDAFTAESGTFYPATVQSNLPHSGPVSVGTFFVAVPCTVSGTTLTIPAVAIDSTSDSPDNPNATYSAVLWDTVAGQPVQPFGTTVEFAVPASPASTSWEALFPPSAATPAGQLSVGTVTELPPGSSPTASITGGKPYLLNIGVPQGPQGIQGIPGPTGPVATVGTLTGNYVDATVTGTQDGTNTTFTVSEGGYWRVLLNGVRLFSPHDYTQSGTTLTLTFAPAPTDNLNVEAYIAYSGGSPVPTNVSQLANDAGYQTAGNVRDILAAPGSIGSITPGTGLFSSIGVGTSSVTVGALQASGGTAFSSIPSNTSAIGYISNGGGKSPTWYGNGFLFSGATAGTAFSLVTGSDGSAFFGTVTPTTSSPALVLSPTGLMRSAHNTLDDGSGNATISGEFATTGLTVNTSAATGGLGVNIGTSFTSAQSIVGSSAGGLACDYDSTNNIGNVYAIKPGVAWGNLVLQPVGQAAIGDTRGYTPFVPGASLTVGIGGVYSYGAISALSFQSASANLYAAQNGTGSLGVGTSTPWQWSNVNVSGAGTNMQVQGSSVSRLIVNATNGNAEFHFVSSGAAAGQKNWRLFADPTGTFTLGINSDNYNTATPMMQASASSGVVTFPGHVVQHSVATSGATPANASDTSTSGVPTQNGAMWADDSFLYRRNSSGTITKIAWGSF